MEALYERIPDLVQQLAREADHVMLQAPEVLCRVYLAEIRPGLQHPRPAWG